MYIVYLDKMELPIAPQKIEVKIKNQNETITLVNEGEVNLLKKPGLSEVSFVMRIPHHNLPFANNLQDVDYYLSYLENLKVDGKPFQFKVLRDMNGLYNTDMTVALEDYNIIEDTNNGEMTYININLKQAGKFEDRKGTIKEKDVDGKKVLVVQETVNRVSDREIPLQTTVREGETLWDVVMRMFGNDDQFANVKDINNIQNPNELEKGTVIWSGHIRTKHN